jgi:hypothetical protein
MMKIIFRRIPTMSEGPRKKNMVTPKEAGNRIWREAENVGVGVMRSFNVSVYSSKIVPDNFRDDALIASLVIPGIEEFH